MFLGVIFVASYLFWNTFALKRCDKFVLKCACIDFSQKISGNLIFNDIKPLLNMLYLGYFLKENFNMIDFFRDCALHPCKFEDF